VFLRPLGEVVVVMPPLTVTDAEIDLLAAALAAAIPEGCE
jgi:adenosylmethionine-8-amino-7-oxononanoate aminotransferase